MVAAIAAGDLAGLTEAYDRYAESLYGYCHTMLGEPEDAADAVQDTFVIAGARLGGLGDPRKLRPWLYAVARNECHRRLGATKVDLDEADDLVDPSADADDSSEQAELRRLARAALDGLSPGEREVIELDLRHDLHGADLAAVLGVPRNQAHALASRARGQLEKALGALLVARTGRRACPELDLLLEDWDGRLTVLTRKRVGRHIDQCDVCTDRMHGVLGRAALYGMAPLPPLPDVLREDVLGLCADVGPLAQSYREDVLQGRLVPAQRLPAADQAAVARAVRSPGGGRRPDRDRSDRDHHGARARRLAHPAAGRGRPVRQRPLAGPRRRRDHEPRIGRRDVPEPFAGHRRAGRHQRAATGRTVFGFGLADQGEAVAAGHVLSTALPHADTTAADAHADVHGHPHAEAHRHAFAAVIAFARRGPDLLRFPLSSYFVLVSG